MTTYSIQDVFDLTNGLRRKVIMLREWVNTNNRMVHNNHYDPYNHLQFIQDELCNIFRKDDLLNVLDTIDDKELFNDVYADSIGYHNDLSFKALEHNLMCGYRNGNDEELLYDCRNEFNKLKSSLIDDVNYLLNVYNKVLIDTETKLGSPEKIQAFASSINCW